jgi:hypothetical protein
MPRSSEGFFPDAHSPGATALPRRVGFFVRMRARFGLLPGQVSTAALIQARRLRRLAWWMAPLVVAFLFMMGLAITTSSTTDRPGTVAAVVGPTDLAGTDAPYGVVLTDGRTLFFDSAPGVSTGEDVGLRLRDDSDPIGLVVDGHYIASTADQGTAAWPLALFVIFIALVFGLTMLPSAIWGRRVYKQLRADLSAPLASGSGRYLGSWTWRGLSTGSSMLRASTLFVLSGFPIAIEERPGELSWYSAPIWMLAELRHFEAQIAGGARTVVFTFHPNTGVLASLSTPDGSSALEFKEAIDALHPETGLSLKVSRRRRHAHLPDR